MLSLSRLVLIRHGETEGESSIRYHGVTDVGLNGVGRDQAHSARRHVPGEAWDLVVASTLSRAWQTARIVAPRQPVRLEADFREIDFGRWEGLTREEIAARDPALYENWMGRADGFEFPDGETRGDFRARVVRGLGRLQSSYAVSAIVVAHKGVVRTIAETLTGEELLPAEPDLGGVIRLVRQSGDHWRFTFRTPIEPG